MAIRIPIGQIKDGINEFDLNISPEEIGMSEKTLKGSIKAFVSVNKISHQLNVNVELSGTLLLECDRCLEIFDRSFSNKFELVYVVRNQNDNVEEDEYVRNYSPFMRYLDITKDARDYVELSVPMRKVPDEKEDGSCSWCAKPAEYWKSIITEKEEDEE